MLAQAAHQHSPDRACLPADVLAAARVLDDPAGYIPQEPFVQVMGALAQGLAALPQALQLPDPRGRYRVVERGHLHPTIEVFIQISGRCRFQFPHESITLNPGQALLIPRALAHTEHVQRVRGKWCNAVVMFGPGQLHVHNAFG